MREHVTTLELVVTMHDSDPDGPDTEPTLDQIERAIENSTAAAALSEALDRDVRLRLRTNPTTTFTQGIHVSAWPSTTVEGGVYIEIDHEAEVPR